ncbi:MAG: hypothetical protein H7X80_11655 [bacterium]|nr:hypothetical protein [Candidatus Kapabacteria bacterium]
MALPSAPSAARKRVGAVRASTTPVASTKERTHVSRRPARRWLTAAMLFVAAALAVAYIANAIAVNNLVDSIASLQRERDVVRSDNERLRGELLRMMSVERVTALASKQIGLISPQRPPIALNANAARSGGASIKRESAQRGEESIRP